MREQFAHFAAAAAYFDVRGVDFLTRRAYRGGGLHNDDSKDWSHRRLHEYYRLRCRGIGVVRRVI